ncbi:hypothetical protein QKW52_11560 [Bacillus sonorensis]|nr:hypothetical protein [Bacillus sonorensis]
MSKKAAITFGCLSGIRANLAYHDHRIDMITGDVIDIRILLGARFTAP